MTTKWLWLNISDEELRKKLDLKAKENSQCQFTKNIIMRPLFYFTSMFSLDEIVKYDCAKRQKISNKKDYHPKNKYEILDK